MQFASIGGWASNWAEKNTICLVANLVGLPSLGKRTTKIGTRFGIAFAIAAILLPSVVQNLFTGIPKAVDAIEKILPFNATKTAQTTDTGTKGCTEFIMGCSLGAITKRCLSISTMALAAYLFVMNGKKTSLLFKTGLFKTGIKMICQSTESIMMEDIAPIIADGQLQKSKRIIEDRLKRERDL